MRHDLERAAAVYLAGEWGQWARARFEGHLLECEGCWRESNTAREPKAERRMRDALAERGKAGEDGQALLDDLLAIVTDRPCPTSRSVTDPGRADRVAAAGFSGGAGRTEVAA
jgi:hypothetical protein